MRTAVARGKGSRYDFSEASSLGRVDQRAQVIALAKQGLIDEWLSWSEAEQTLWEFTTCQRSDGSLYGSRGKCHQGKEVSKDQAALQRKSNARRKSGRYGGTLKQRVARDATANHLGAQHRELEKKHRAAKRRFDKAADELEKDRWNATKRDNYKKAERESNAAFTAAERAKARLKRRLREIEREHAAQNTKAPSRKKLPDFPANWSTGNQLV